MRIIASSRGALRASRRSRFLLPYWLTVILFGHLMPTGLVALGARTALACIAFLEVTVATGSSSHRYSNRLMAWLWSRRKTALFFILAGIVTFALEHYVEHVVNNGGETAGIPQTIFGAGYSYQKLVTTWPKRPVPRFSVLLYIDPVSDPTAKALGSNICDQRRYIAELLVRVAAQRPKVIVLDRYFPRDGCKAGGVDDPTELLKRTIAAVPRDIAVIVGMRLERKGDSNPTIRPSIAFDPGSAREAIVNIGRDTSRIALGWGVDREGLPSGEFVYGLALEAAFAYDNQLFSKYPELIQMAERGTQPHMTLVPPSEFISYRGSDFLCAKVPDKEQATGCKLLASDVAGGKARPDPSYVNGRVVFIGEAHNEIDIHRTALGPVQGMELQATALEAILNDRHYFPAPEFVNIVCGLLLLFVIDGVLKLPSGLAAIGAAGVVLLLTFGLLSLSVQYFNLYINPAAGFLALVFKGISWIGQRIDKFGEPIHAK